MISQLPSTLARVHHPLLAAIDGLGLSLAGSALVTKTRTTAESGCGSDTAARTTLAVVSGDVGRRSHDHCCVNWS